MSADSNEIISRLSGKILTYLLRHPRARDTPNGIRFWWLGGAYTEREVEKVLRELAAHGLLLTRTSHEGPTLYSLNSERMKDCESQLNRCCLDEDAPGEP